MKPVTNNNYTEIFRAISVGNRQAFEWLFINFRDSVYAAAFRWTKSAWAAEEITQDTFLAIWSLRSNLAAVEDSQAYLYRIVANKVNRHLKKEINRNRILRLALRNTKTAVDETEDALCAKESSRFVERAVEMLPPQKKIIFRMSREDGKSYEEIAKMLKLSRNTVKTHLGKALKEVRRYLQQKTLFFF